MTDEADKPMMCPRCKRRMEVLMGFELPGKPTVTLCQKCMDEALRIVLASTASADAGRAGRHVGTDYPGGRTATRGDPYGVARPEETR